MYYYLCLIGNKEAPSHLSKRRAESGVDRSHKFPIKLFPTSEALFPCKSDPMTNGTLRIIS